MRLHQSVDEFRAIAEPLYRRDPVAHTIELTLLEANKFPDGTADLKYGAASKDIVIKK